MSANCDRIDLDTVSSNINQMTYFSLKSTKTYLHIKPSVHQLPQLQCHRTNCNTTWLCSNLRHNVIKNQIAELNTELAKQKTNLSETSAQADSAGDMKETLRVMEQKFDDKIKELLTVQSKLDLANRTIEEKDQEIAQLQDRAEDMEDQMREFTSIANVSLNDETFESVLRKEFEMMR